MSSSTPSWSGVPGFDPAYMLDQSHNVTDPIESLMTSTVELVRAYVQAHLVDREALAEYQQANDPLMALQTLKQAFTTDVAPDSGDGARPRRGRDRSDRRVSFERLSRQETCRAAGGRRAWVRGSSDDSQSVPHVGEPGARDRYERRHNPIWQELTDALSSHGVTSYSIFIDPITRDLFAYAEIESEDRWKRSPTLMSAAGGGRTCARSCRRIPTTALSHGRCPRYSI